MLQTDKQKSIYITLAEAALILNGNMVEQGMHCFWAPLTTVSRNWQNYLDVMMATNRFEWPLLYQ
jgi:hypothetical protein